MEPFVEQALIIISFSVVFVPLFYYLGFGTIVGYLIAGILVGPYGLKLIQDANNIHHFSELGVVLLLFMIGLEIQPHKLWSMRNHLFGLGAMQVFFSSILFMTISLLSGISFVASLIIGFAFSLSSTAFAVQTLVDKNQFKTEFGRSSFSILLMQDLAAIPALAIIPFLTQKFNIENSPPFSLTKLLGILALIFGLILASRYLISPALRLLASTRSREIFTGATLFVVLGVATLMQTIGLSAALGTFIAGVLLADSEYRHELETNISPFKGILMGLFFISAGMSVNLNLLEQQPLVVIFGAILYLILKSGVIYVVGRLFRLSHENSKLVALNIAQGGEFAFVIFAMISKSQLMETSVLQYLTAIITISMILNPLLIMINEKVTLKWRTKNETPEFDQISSEEPEIIIAGFGRFGQIFGRILKAQNIPYVAIDHNPNQIELIRKFGNKVYYGDASREDTLLAAGADKAKFLILAITDLEYSLKTAETVRKHFPKIKIYARARNRGHTFDLMDLGIETIKRETFDSSTNFVKELLVDLGFSKEKAAKVVERFIEHDEIMLKEQYKVRQDDKVFVSISKQGSAQLAQVLKEDSMQSQASQQDS